ncbi:hypothetical protein NL676_030334 [Syzygium grande]|nr:hypothetical protein NL676_030334 [Syzygium grande]
MEKRVCRGREEGEERVLRTRFCISIEQDAEIGSSGPPAVPAAHTEGEQPPPPSPFNGDVHRDPRARNPSLPWRPLRAPTSLDLSPTRPSSHRWAKHKRNTFLAPDLATLLHRTLDFARHLKPIPVSCAGNLPKAAILPRLSRCGGRDPSSRVCAGSRLTGRTPSHRGTRARTPTPLQKMKDGLEEVGRE